MLPKYDFCCSIWPLDKSTIPVKLLYASTQLYKSAIIGYSLWQGVIMRGDYGENALKTELRLLSFCKNRPQSRSAINEKLDVDEDRISRGLQHLIDCGCLAEGEKSVYHLTIKGSNALAQSGSRNFMREFNIS